MEKFYIPILESEGVIVYLKHRWQSERPTGSTITGIAIASTDGKKHQFIYGQPVSEVVDAVEHLLGGHSQYGREDKYGVFARLLTLNEAVELKIPDVTKPCVYVDWQETMGMADPVFHIKGTQLLLLDELARWLTKNYNTNMRHKASITDSRGKKITLQKALENPREHAPLTLTYQESIPGSKLPNIVTQTIRFK